MAKTFSLAKVGIQRKLTFLFYLVALISVTIIGFYGYFHASSAYLDKAIALEDASTTRTADQISAFLQLARDDLLFIGKFYAMQRYLYWEDLGDQAKMEYWQNIAISTARDFIDAHSYHYKISLIDNLGTEQFALRRDPLTNKVGLNLNSNSQPNTEYATLSRTLKRGEVSVAPLTVNVDDNYVEQPPILVLRLIAPLRGTQDANYGLVSVKIFAKSIFAPIITANNNLYGQHFYLIDSTGQYLFNPNEKMSLGHANNHYTSFYQDYPGLFSQFHNQDSGIIHNNGRIHTFRIIQQDLSHPANSWYLVGIVNESDALTELNSFAVVFLGLFVTVFLGVWFSTNYIVRELMRPLGFVTRQLQRLGRGETIPETFKYLADDEIREILDSTRLVVANMQRLARQVNAIAAGDFKSQVVPLSEQDQLGTAINDMTRRLAATQLTNDQRNWLKDGLSHLSQALTGDLASTRLATEAISQISRYLGAGRGVFYVFDSDAASLELLGSYMYTERNALGANVKLGQGAVGQVARERKPIILNIGVATDPTAPIVTGTVITLPRYTYTWPMLWETDLYGIIEIAVANRLGEIELEYMEEAANTCAYFLYAALQRERVKDLLEETEAASRQIRGQNLRLQEANNLMEEQQQQLQQQTEELQQINAEMEEQQQQLQQQAVELRYTNSQLNEQQQHLEMQAKELESRNSELEQASRYKSEFLANMSHELRTPLNSILLLSKMLAANEDCHLSSEETKRAQVIHAAGSDLLNLINDILDLSKIEAGKMELNPQLITSTALVADWQRQFEDTANAKGLAFSIEDTWNSSFTSDRDKLNQIVRNFLSNAFKFTQQGKVTLSLHHSNEPQLPICIAVTDTGIGIPEEKQQLIFVAFQQVDGSISRRFGGTGLGLSISLSLAQLLNGTIQVSSTIGKGSEFRLLLPLHLNPPPFQRDANSAITSNILLQAPVITNIAPLLPEPKLHSEFIPETSPTDDRSNITPGDSVILVIDDDPLFNTAITQINRNHGHKTLLAINGAEGLRLAQAYRPLGILLDLGLPDMDGMEVLKNIKSNRDLYNTPIYVISGRERAPEILRQGIVGYLQKPVSDRQILDIENQMLKLATAPPSVLVVTGDGLQTDTIRRLLLGSGVVAHTITTPQDACQICTRTACKLLLLGLDPNAGFQRCLTFCQELHELLPTLPIMIYAQEGVSGEQEAALRPYTDSIVVQTLHADKRILENIERFACEVHNLDQCSVTTTVHGTKNRLHGRHILVVDDDGRNLFVVTSALEQQGARVSNAIDGINALELLHKEPVDLVFMDIMMPKMNGYKAIAAIKTDPILKSIPVIALTAKAFKDDHKQALDSGADDYLSKPVDYQVLVNMAVVWCDRYNKTVSHVDLIPEV